jgi:hypothetical protein
MRSATQIGAHHRVLADLPYLRILAILAEAAAARAEPSRDGESIGSIA